MAWVRAGRCRTALPPGNAVPSKRIPDYVSSGGNKSASTKRLPQPQQSSRRSSATQFATILSTEEMALLPVSRTSALGIVAGRAKKFTVMKYHRVAGGFASQRSVDSKASPVLQHWRRAHRYSEASSLWTNPAISRPDQGSFEWLPSHRAPFALCLHPQKYTVPSLSAL